MVWRHQTGELAPTSCLSNCCKIHDIPVNVEKGSIPCWFYGSKKRFGQGGRVGGGIKYNKWWPVNPVLCYCLLMRLTDKKCWKNVLLKWGTNVLQRKKKQNRSVAWLYFGSTGIVTRTELSHIQHIAHLTLHTESPLPTTTHSDSFSTTYLFCTLSLAWIYQPLKAAQCWSEECREVRAAGLAADILENDWDCEESVRERWRAPLNQFLLNLTPVGTG